MNRSFEQGTIFAQELEEQKGYVYGRILLDIGKLLRKEIISKKQQLSFFSDAFLVEAFSRISSGLEEEFKPGKKAISGIFLDKEATEDKVWLAVGRQIPAVEDLDFPEYLLNIEGRIHLIKGEIQVPLEMTVAEADRINCRPTMFSSLSFGDLTAKAVGKEELVPEFWRDRISLGSSDLRFGSKAVRDKLFRMNGLNPDRSYAELARDEILITTD